MLVGFIKDGLIMADSYAPRTLSHRHGGPGGAPNPGTVDALKRTLLQAKSIGYSASVSGEYLTTVLYQRLGIADQVMSKAD